MYGTTLVRRGLPIIAAAVACAAVLTGAAGATVITEPWQADTCLTSGCTWSPSTGDYVSGGDGGSIADYLGGSWGDLSPLDQRIRTIEMEASDELPSLELVPGLQTILIGTAAFQFGWLVGSTVNHKWLHLAGVGLGTASGSTVRQVGWSNWPGGSNNCNGPHTYPAGKRLTLYSDVEGTASIGFFPPGTPYSTPATDAAWLWIQTNGLAKSGLRQYCPGAPGATGYSYIVDIPYPVFNSDGLQVDQGPQPYTNQHVDGSSGWKVAGGCGDTSNACSYPGVLPNPVLKKQGLRCQLSGDSSDCGTGTPWTCVLSDGTPFFGGAGSTGCGLGPGPENELNCQADPAEYACPSQNSDGTNFTSTGGGGGGSGDDDGTPTSPNDDPCKFDRLLGGLTEWQTRNYDGSYDEECAEAFEILRNAGLLDSNNTPTSLGMSQATNMIRGDELGNATVREAMLERVPGSSLQDWWKVTSETFKTSEGHSFALHFYLYEGASGPTLLLDYDYFVVFVTSF